MPAISAGTLADEADDLPALRRIFETNVIGMAQTFQPFIAAMKARGSGRLAGIASVAGIRGLPGAGAYSASKAATIAYLEALRVELRGSGVKVVTIAPGYIATPMTAVNRYPMPFLMPADAAARRFARAIERGTSYTVIPWQMGVVAKLLRLLPDAAVRCPVRPRRQEAARPRPVMSWFAGPRALKSPGASRDHPFSRGWGISRCDALPAPALCRACRASSAWCRA
jgi:short-subunit dehydrogenase